METSGSWAQLQIPSVSVALSDSAWLKRLGTAGSPAAFIAPPIDTTTVSGISAPEANQSQIWAVIIQKVEKTIVRHLYKAEDILFEANPNINMDMGLRNQCL